VEIQARPVRALVILEIAAGPHREDASDLAQRPAQVFDVGIRPQVARPVVADLARHREAWHRLLHADLHVREALVVLEQDVVGGMVPPDHRRFQQQRLGFGRGHDRVQVHRAGHHLADPGLRLIARQVVPDPQHEALGLPHIQHLAAEPLKA
jgi:hypothetical protein